MLKVQESYRGASAFSINTTGSIASLEKLIGYATHHVANTDEAEGALTILVYDGHGVHNDDSGSTVHLLRDGTLVPIPEVVPTLKVSLSLFIQARQFNIRGDRLQNMLWDRATPKKIGVNNMFVRFSQSLS